MSDLMKYNAIMPRHDDDYHLWYDRLKGFRLYIRGIGNCGFNQEAEVLFQIERERILAMKKEIINCVIDYGLTPEKYERICNDIDAVIKGENK